MRFCSLLLLLSFSLAAKAQKKDTIPVLHKITRNHRWKIAFSPFAIIQPDNTLMTGAEYILKPRLRLVADAGYVFYSLGFSENSGPASGFIFRPGVKYFTSKIKGYYVQGQVFYKRVIQTRHDWVDKDVINGVASYQQFEDFNVRRNVVGLNILYGETEPFFKMKNVFVDVYVGLGLRKRFSKAVVGENDRYNLNQNRREWSFANDDELLPSLPIGVRLLFVIR